MPVTIFLSHSTHNDATVAALRAALESHSVSVCVTMSGDCLTALGRLEEAAAAYETAIGLDEQRTDLRDVAVGRGQLGIVRLHQGNYPAALAAFTTARDTFTQLNEPASVAVAWQQIGQVH
jgi:tetratricopeptide (TPR) repeat protein